MVSREVLVNSDVRYAPKLERNLKSLGRLEVKRCSFKASDETLKVIRESMMLMRGKSENNLYMLQVSGGWLGHKVDEIDCGSPKKVTFDNGGRVEPNREIISARVNSLSVGDDVYHLIDHFMTYTL